MRPRPGETLKKEETAIKMKNVCGRGTARVIRRVLLFTVAHALYNHRLSWRILLFTRKASVLVFLFCVSISSTCLCSALLLLSRSIGRSFIHSTASWDNPWSQIQTLLPLDARPLLLSRTACSIPTARRLSPNFANSHAFFALSAT